MAQEPNYYAALGLQADANEEAIEAAYRGRSLRFRVGQPRARATDQVGATQEQIEQAYAILGDPEARALYDANHLPTKPPRTVRRRVPPWVWVLGSMWLVALLIVGCVGIRSRASSDDNPIGRIISQTVTAGAVAEGGKATATPSIGAATTARKVSPTSAALLPTTATSTTVTVSLPPVPVRTTIPISTPRPTLTVAPTATELPTAAAAPLPPPVVSEPAPAPEPTPPPSFRATDRIGTTLPVNLRSGPGSGYRSFGLLPTGTPLQATGETVSAGGQLWRRFVLEDGQIGWVRDLDVLPAQ